MKSVIIIVLLVTLLCLIYKTNHIEGFSNNSLINKIYFINLDKSKDRLEYINKQLSTLSIPVERFPAVDGSKLNINLLKKTGILKTDKMMKGAVGCSLSHINIWKKIKKDNIDNVLVLEDDVQIDPDFEKKLNEYSSQIPKDFDILYLGGSNIYGKKLSKNIIKPIMLDDNSTRNTGMYAMLINKKVIDKLLQNCQPIEDNIDQVVKNKLFKEINTYYLYPPLVTHNNEFDSMRRINSNRQPKTRWFYNTQHKITIL